MNNIKKYFSLNGEMTGREWVMMKVIQFVVFILISIFIFFIPINTALQDYNTLIFMMLGFYTSYIKSGPIFSLFSSLFLISMPLLAILCIPLLACNAWIEIISAIKRCKATGINPILGLAILHIGLVLHFMMMTLSRTVPGIFAGYYEYLVLCIVIFVLFVQYRFFGIDKNKNTQP